MNNQDKYISAVAVPNGVISNKNKKLTLGVSLCYQINLAKYQVYINSLEKDEISNLNTNIRSLLISNKKDSDVLSGINLKFGDRNKAINLSLEKVKTSDNIESKGIVDSLFKTDKLLTNTETSLIADIGKLTSPSSGIQGLIDLEKKYLKTQNNDKLKTDNEKEIFFNNYLNEKKEELRLENEAKFDFAESLNKLTATANSNLTAEGRYDTELLYLINAIEDNTTLARLLGWIVDYKFVLDLDQLQDLQSVNFKINLGKDSSNPINFLHFPDTAVSIMKNKIKDKKEYRYAFTPQNSPHFEKYFNYNILNHEKAKTIVTPVTLDAVYHSLFNNQNDGEDQISTGIKVTSKSLKEIIKPIDPIDTLKDDFCYYNEHLMKGFGVAIKVAKDNLENIPILPLTQRKVTVNKGGVNILPQFDEEDFIKIDSVIQYLDNEGELVAEANDLIFEYDGELLSLNSVFGNDENDERVGDKEDVDKILQNAEKRFDEIFQIRTFPFNNKNIESDYANVNNKIWFSYDIPSQYADKKSITPKLRYGYKFQAVVYLGFINGNSSKVSSTKENEVEITLTDLLSMADSKWTITKPFPYTPTEKKGQFVAISSEQVTPQNKKPQNEFIVKSESFYDKDQSITYKHILGPKIDYRAAWLHGAFENLSSKKSYEILARSLNSSLKQDRNGEKREDESHPLFEKGSHITANYLTDPEVHGFKLIISYSKKLVSDKENTNNFLMKYIDFRKNNGRTEVINQKSIQLKASGAKSITHIYKSKDSIDVNVKKGAELYMHLLPIGANNKTANSEPGWLQNLKVELKDNHEENSSKFASKFTQLLKSKKQNKFQGLTTFKLTHAVKKPLIAPNIEWFYSVGQSPASVLQDIQLSLKEFKSVQTETVYILDKNIITKELKLDSVKNYTIDQQKTTSKISLKALFERLDAKEKEGFIDNVLPTGALEVWIKKEEYIDDPEELIFEDDRKSRLTPNSPVYSFDNKSNIFKLYHTIEFQDELLDAVKNENCVYPREDIKNVFVRYLTELDFTFDIKSHEFEEIKIVLRGQSKFNGYFGDTEESNEYSLPIVRDGQFDQSYVFPAMTLNSQKPLAPEIKYAVTTIKETRSIEEKKSEKNWTKSTQEGNIITIYLDRGRLSSGKDERVAILLKNFTPYNDYYSKIDYFSKIGTDAVTDSSKLKNRYLACENIIIPKDNIYDVKKEKGLKVISGLPIFDIEKQLWKIEFEIDLKNKDEPKTEKDLHNPFIHFSLVHYQPFSLNYSSGDNPLNDLRFSEVTTGVIGYLLPKRTTEAILVVPKFWNDIGSASINISFDKSSLYLIDQNKTQSNFVVTIEGSFDGVIWESLCSYEENKQGKKNNQFHHFLIQDPKNIPEKMLTKDLKFSKWNSQNQKMKHFRIRMIEIEYFNEINKEELLSNQFIKNVLDNDKLRVRYVELIY